MRSALTRAQSIPVSLELYVSEICLIDVGQMLWPAPVDPELGKTYCDRSGHSMCRTNEHASRRQSQFLRLA